ncbi:MAG: Mov34/MPN/PAD-1 family protein [Candidatus Helarchaeota archaeon]
MIEVDIILYPMAFAKMVYHTSSNIHKEVAGYLIGKVLDENTVAITDVAIARQQGTSVHVTLNDEDQALIAQRLEQEELGEVIIGWYHSHPKMGAHFFSSTDVSTQKRYQYFLNQAVGLVLDPYKYVLSGQITDLDIHAWRVDEREMASEVSFTMLKDNNRVILNILEHLKRQNVLESAVSQIIYNLNPKLEHAISDILGISLGGSFGSDKILNLRKLILFSIVIQALIITGIFLIVWAVILYTF